MTPPKPDKLDARRLLSATLIILGAALFLLAPETWPGMALLALGALLELIGMSLAQRRRSRTSRQHPREDARHEAF